MSLPTPERPRGVVDLSTLGKQPQAWAPGGLPATDAPAPTGPPCSKCGKPMPELPAELAAIARTQSVTLSHDVCPDEVVVPQGRYFEVRCQIVEVTEQDITPSPIPGERGPVTEELITFRSGGRWPDLDTAMRPLALLLGEKWQAAEKQAKLADLDPTTGQPR